MLLELPSFIYYWSLRCYNNQMTSQKPADLNIEADILLRQKELLEYQI